jgi:predicted secreted protein
MRRLQAVVVVALAFCAASPAATAPLVLTQADSGTSFRLHRGQTARLRLANRWTWTEPHVTGRSIRLVPVRYRTDPGYREWKIRTTARGRATIRAKGAPRCSSCSRTARHFQVVIRVR